MLSWFVPIVVLAIIIFPQAARILLEYERGVVLSLLVPQKRIH